MDFFTNKFCQQNETVRPLQMKQDKYLRGSSTLQNHLKITIKKKLPLANVKNKICFKKSFAFSKRESQNNFLSHLFFIKECRQNKVGVFLRSLYFF